jgi:hypothetical protein
MNEQFDPALIADSLAEPDMVTPVIEPSSARRTGTSRAAAEQLGERRAEAPPADWPGGIVAPDADAIDTVKELVRNHLIEEANRYVGSLLDDRIKAGDSQLQAVALLLQHYHTILAMQPPLSHIGPVPLRPDDRLYACFDQFLDLLRRQDSQILELQMMISELV